MSLESVPVVELDRYHSAARESFIRELGDSLRHFGFVRVKGHGVDPALVREAYALFERLFLLPPEVKEKYDCRNAGQRGFVGFGKERAKNQRVADLKEFWHVGRELPAGHRFAGLYPPNVWPSEIPELKTVTLRLYDALEKCAGTLMSALAQYLGSSPDVFEHVYKDGNSILRAINYPPLLPGDDPNAVRAAAHEDVNLLTLLCEATSSGLEILTRDGRWLAIDSLEGQIVADAGDMMALITNEVIPSTTHRVTNPPGERNSPRYSLPFFVHAAPDVLLEPLPSCIDSAHPRLHEPILARDFLEQRLRELGLKKGM